MNNLIKLSNLGVRRPKGLRHTKVLIALLTILFLLNLIKSHSSLTALTPAQVCDINYTHQEKVN